MADRIAFGENLRPGVCWLNSKSERKQRVNKFHEKFFFKKYQGSGGVRVTQSHT